MYIYSIASEGMEQLTAGGDDALGLGVAGR